MFEVSEAVVQRSSRLEVFCAKGVLKDFAKFTGKHLCQGLFLKAADLRPVTLLKKSLWHRCFPADFAKFLRATFFTEQIHRLLLKFISNHTKEMVYVNTNLMGNQPWSKNKHFLLFLILMLKKPLFFNVKLKLLRKKCYFFISFMNTFLEAAARRYSSKWVLLKISQYWC